MISSSLLFKSKMNISYDSIDEKLYVIKIVKNNNNNNNICSKVNKISFYEEKRVNMLFRVKSYVLKIFYSSTFSPGKNQICRKRFDYRKRRLVAQIHLVQ